jgi:hypothetical protein
LSGDGKDVQRAISALRELTALETQTLVAEMNLMGLLRDRISSAARYGDTIQTEFRRLNYKTPMEAEQATYLSEGFPFKEEGKALNALLVLDNYSTQALPAADAAKSVSGQYTGERLYLTMEKKWIIAERAGEFSEDAGSVSEWQATCRNISDRHLLDRYPLEAITEGLFAAANRLCKSISPRIDELKKRYEKAGQVANLVTNLRVSPRKRQPAAVRKKKRRKLKSELRNARSVF